MATILAVAALASALRSSASWRGDLPEELGDDTFWQLIAEFSEPDASGRTENLVSGELSTQRIIPTLRELVPPGGVYLGVGQEQNFTSIAALKSRMAFVIDSSRRNMLEMLMYKAVFELSPTRADFVGRLFTRKRPTDLDENTPVSGLFAAYKRAEPDDLAANSQAVRAALLNHGFPLTRDDLDRISRFQQVFSEGGPSMRFDFTGAGPAREKSATYADLMTATDSDGRQWSYLASEDSYRHVRDLQRRNLVIPIVGEFLGPTALKSIGLYLQDRKASVSAFYVSNVEMGIDGPLFKDFQANVVTLPVTPSSVFIRWVPASSAQFLPWYRPNMGPAVASLASMNNLIDLFMLGNSPASWAETLHATKEPEALLRNHQDPSLRRVMGRVLGTARLNPDESLRVELVENPRGAGLIFETAVRPDGTFEFSQVQPRVYEAIVLKTCRSCGFSTGMGSPVRVVITNKDVSGLKLVMRSR